jgi:hypothetical protein
MCPSISGRHDGLGSAVEPRLALFGTEESGFWLRQREIGIYKNAQSATLSRQLVEPLIFQREFQENVARADPKEEGNEANEVGKNAHGEEHRHEIEYANARGEGGKQSARPLEKEQLKPGVSNFVSQQNAQRFSYADQITERAGVVSADELFVRHIGWDK